MYICLYIHFIFNKYSCFVDFVKCLNFFTAQVFLDKYIKQEHEEEGGCGEVKDSA